MKTIEIQARRWFQSSYGNTYFTGEIYVNDALAATIKNQYGYGDHCAYELLDAAIKAGILPEKERNTQAPWKYAEDNGFNLLVNIKDVKRKKDM